MKKIIILILIAILVLTIPIGVAAEDTDSPYFNDALKLNALELFLGTGESFELLRAPKRVEAAVMLVRLTGKEEHALAGSFEHPFTDVPEWADPYVGYLYEAGLTKGIGDNLYDPDSLVDAKTYLTFLLRTLDYSDDAGDFTWEEAVSDALSLELISQREFDLLESEEFTRGHMAAMSYNALNTLVKGFDFTLASVLVDQRVFGESDALAERLLMEKSPEKRYLPYLEDGQYMPFIEGDDIITAEIKMRKAGFDDFEYVYEIHEIVPEGYVISQSCPAYIDSSLAGPCVITVSRGPSLPYHLELTDICLEKGWDEEIHPYVIGASKYLIKNTILSKYDVFNRIEENLNDIVVLNYEDSAAMGYAAFYDASTGNMYINRYVLSYDLILHELIHALSNNPDTGKVGFVGDGDNNRAVTEAFVESIAAKALGLDSGALNTFRTGTETIVFSSDSYFSDSDLNYVLGVYSPLFILAGDNRIEKMYFKDAGAHSSETLAFNERYGERRWETLWSLADYFIDDPGFLSEDDRLHKITAYRSYLDGILECLYIDLSEHQSDDSALRLLLFKTRDIKKSYPLGYADYRERIEDLENEIISLINDPEFTEQPIEPGKWIVPDYTGKSPEYVYNSLTIEGGASAIGYMVVESDGTDEGIQGVLYKEPGMSTEDAQLVNESDIKPLEGEYIILIPGEMPPEGGYSLMRDLVSDFNKYLADYSRLADYAVVRLLKTEGFGVRYEFIYYEDTAPAMEGRILSQFPAPGTAIVPGDTLIRIFMVRGLS